MKTFKKTVSLLLAGMMLAAMCITLKPDTATKAANNVATPTFTLKRVNSGTGVKIVINKTKGATGYYIYMTKRDNAYSSYLRNDGKSEQKIAEIKKNGKSKRTYIINGLQKGTYSFKVQAYKKEKVYDTSIGIEYTDTDCSDYSIEKSISIKAAKKKTVPEKTYDFSNVKVGDIIKFGSYEQDDDMTNGKEEIEWIVLSKDSKRILVVSKYALDCLPYEKEYTDITWENSTIREWLNSKFYTTAFTKKERNMINKVKLTNADNPYYDIEGGNDTKDSVFLLSLDDLVNVAYGFKSDIDEKDIARRCAATAYAKTQGAESAEQHADESEWKPYYATTDGEPTCMWWLRSPGEYAINAAYVYPTGAVNECGWHVDNNGSAVRPALYIDLKS